MTRWSVVVHRSDYSQLLSPTYAILMVLIGLLLPMTEALQHKWHKTIYNMVCPISLYIMPILKLL